MLKGITENGMFILNTERTKEEVLELLPNN